MADTPSPKTTLTEVTTTTPTPPPPPSPSQAATMSAKRRWFSTTGARDGDNDNGRVRRATVPPIDDDDSEKGAVSKTVPAAYFAQSFDSPAVVGGKQQPPHLWNNRGRLRQRRVSSTLGHGPLQRSSSSHGGLKKRGDTLTSMTDYHSKFVKFVLLSLFKLLLILGVKSEFIAIVPHTFNFLYFKSLKT